MFTWESWWNDLSMDEQNVLIEMLYKMNGEDFRQFGVKINDKDKYIKETK